MKILIVDDSKAMRTFLRFLVRDLALEADEAADGCEALAALNGPSTYDLALVDWDMPHMNGLELVRKVRADPRFDALKLMMVTTQNSLEQVAEAINSGASDFLMKPVTRESLEEKLLVLGIME